MRYIPAGPKRDELLGLVRVGIKFSQQQHAGRRPGFLHRYIVGIAERIKPTATFEALLEELELEAARRAREADGEAGTPVETVNRVWELVTYHPPEARAIASRIRHPAKLFYRCKERTIHGFR